MFYFVFYLTLSINTFYNLNLLMMSTATTKKIHEGRNVKRFRECWALSRMPLLPTLATTGTSKSFTAGTKGND